MSAIAVVSYDANKYSETFIRYLVENLPFEVHPFYNGELPRYHHDNQPFLPNSGWRKVLIAIKELWGTNEKKQQEDAIEAYLIQNKIQVVYCNYSITALPFMDICERNSISLIVHFRGWTAYRQTILDKYGHLYPRLFTLASAIICVSSDMKKQLMLLGAEENKISVIPSGANTEIFTYSNHALNPLVFLAVGRFCDTKNPHLTILAFSKVLQQLPNAKLVMVGGDETLLCACINLCKALKIENHVQFKGILPQHMVFEEMKGAYAFVQHSALTCLNEKEGTPNSIMEACASGLPVIATRHAGILDVVVDGITGLLCDEFDLDAMADNMIRVARDKELAYRLGVNASKHIKENFTAKQCIDKVTAVITKAISSNKLN